MEQTDEQRIAEERYLELCQVASIGGSLQPGLIVEAGKAAGFPADIKILCPGDQSWPINTMIADAIYNDRINFSGAMGGTKTVLLDSTEFLVGPWYEAFDAIYKWRQIFKPNWYGWEGRHEEQSIEERLDKLIATIPTEYVFDPVELKFLIGEVGWSRVVTVTMPEGVPHQDQKNTMLPLDAFEILPLCENGAVVLHDTTISLPYPHEGTKYSFMAPGFIKIVEALTQRAHNLKIPW